MGTEGGQQLDSAIGGAGLVWRGTNVEAKIKEAQPPTGPSLGSVRCFTRRTAIEPVHVNDLEGGLSRTPKSKRAVPKKRPLEASDVSHCESPSG